MSAGSTSLSPRREERVRVRGAAPRAARLLALTLILLLIFTLVPIDVSATPLLQRIAGDDRYHTAVRVSQAGWPSADTVVLARGDDYPDALAGAPLAHQLGAPILLTRSDTLPEATLEEIRRLAATRVIILGGTAAVSAQVEQQLAAAGLQVERIGGANRFDTAALIARRLGNLSFVFMAYGHNFPDALAAAAYAARQGFPILLTDTETIPAETMAVLRDAGNVFLVGGEKVISEDIFLTLSFDLGKSPVRIAGADRYNTAIELAKHFSPPNRNMLVATGLQFPDAITGGVLAARRDTGILLVRDPVTDSLEYYINDYQIQSLTILGGEAAVNRSVAGRLTDLLAGPPAVPPVTPEPPADPRIGFRVRNGQLFGLDFWGAEVLLTEAPGFLPAGDYVADREFNFFRPLPGGGQLEHIGNFNYLEKIPYATLHLHTAAPARADAAFLSQAANRIRPGTPLAGLSESFIRAQQTWGINAVFLMSLAALESAWGTSRIAREKNNLFGFMAFDRDPFHYAATFQSKADSIHYVSAFIRRAYLSEGGRFFRGPNLADMNRFYASDPMWSIKVARVMNAIIPYNAGEIVAKQLVPGQVAAPGEWLNLRRGPGVNAEIITILSQGAPLEIEGLEVVGEDYWLKVKSSEHGSGWVYGAFVSMQGTVRGSVFFPSWFLPENKGLYLNVRTAPGTDNAAVGRLSFGDQVTVEAMRMVGRTIWYRVSHPGNGEHWVSGDFVIVDW